jgi:hypothetical protein
MKFAGLAGLRGMALTGRRKGDLSLLVMAAGFVGMEVLARSGVLASAAWKMLTMAFEAGVIGGLAD